MQCYQGDHSKCCRLSQLCAGRIKNNWFYKSIYLPNNFKMTLNDVEKQELQHCIEFRISTCIIRQLENLFTTQKCEAVNRAISTSVPKNVTYSRNYCACVHSAVKRVNCGSQAEAMYQQAEYIGAPFPRGTQVCRSLYKMKLECEKKQEKSKSKSARIKRHNKKKNLYDKYDSKKAAKTYRTGQLLESVPLKPHCMEHNYSQRTKFINVNKKQSQT